MTYILLNDPAGQQQRLLRQDHISAVEVKKADRSVTIFLIGGQEIHLTHEESKQFIQHMRSVSHPID
jgi:hypothetical protein